MTLGAPIRIRESGFVGSDDVSFEQDSQRDSGAPAPRAEAAPPPTRRGNTRVDATVYVVFEAGAP